MKSKIIGIVILSTMLIGCMTGCSEKEATPDNVGDKINSMSDEELESAIIGGADKLESENFNSEEAENTIPSEITASDEIKSEKKFTNKIQIGSKVYTFPLKISDLLENGELRLEGIGSSDDTNENSLIKANEKHSFALNGTGVHLLLNAYNNADSMTQLKNCIVDAEDISISSKNDNVFLSGGLKLGMPYTEFIELYGEPDYIDEKNDIYYYYEDPYYSHSYYMTKSATGFFYQIKIDMDSACISDIKFGIGNRNKDYEKKLAIAHTDYGYYVNLPGDFASDDIMLTDANGKKYLLTAFFSTKTNEYPYEGDFPEELTEENLTNIHETDASDVKYCKVNNDGTAFVIKLRHERDYVGCYYDGDLMAEIMITTTNIAKDDEKEIPEIARDNSYNLLKDILEKGIIFEKISK